MRSDAACPEKYTVLIHALAGVGRDAQYCHAAADRFYAMNRGLTVKFDEGGATCMSIEKPRPRPWFFARIGP